jgi:arylformamidase
VNAEAAIVFRGMDRAALDAGLNNGKAVPNSGEITAGWQKRSDALRAAHPDSLDLRYGKDERNRIDVFEAKPGAPLFVFLHGGYWQSRQKELFSFVAEGPLAHGINVALVGYTLAPEKRLDGIVGEVRAALDFLAKKYPDRKIIVSGWSAGGHLTAMVMDHPAVKAGLAISGVYDLEPIRLSYLNEKLRLDEAEQKRNSPMLQAPKWDKPFTLTYGGDELPELRRQSEAYAQVVKHAKLQPVPGRNHFTMLDELRAPDGALAKMARDLAR